MARKLGLDWVLFPPFRWVCWSSASVSRWVDRRDMPLTPRGTSVRVSCMHCCLFPIRAATTGDIRGSLLRLPSSARLSQRDYTCCWGDDLTVTTPFQSVAYITLLAVGRMISGNKNITSFEIIEREPCKTL